MAFGADRYTWNTRDELVGLTRPGLTASFAYDVFGRRHTKTINSVATTYLSDGDEVVAEYAPNGTPTYTLHSPFIDEPIRRGDAYLTPDRLGSTTTLTDEVGTVVERYAYLPFGETLASVGPAQSNPYQFTGRENDGTGLMYYRARYYAPEWGRFLSEDPIGLAGGGNVYSYAGNDPVNGTDPSGLAEASAELRQQKLDALLAIYAGAISRVPVVGAGLGSGRGAAARPGVLPASSTGRPGLWQRIKDWVGRQFSRPSTPVVTPPPRVIRVYHKGNLSGGRVQVRAKPFSTGTSKADVDAVVSGDKPIHSFDIPEAVFTDWLRKRWVTEVYTEMGGRRIREYRFGAAAQQRLEEYRSQ